MRQAKPTRLLVFGALLALLTTISTPLLADANGTVYYSYEPFPLRGHGGHAFVPRSLARGGERRALAEAVITLLRGAKGTLYEGVEVTFSEGLVKLTKKGGDVPAVVRGELYLSLRALGFQVQTVPTVDGPPFANTMLVARLTESAAEERT